jgi:hypothetical protein
MELMKNGLEIGIQTNLLSIGCESIESYGSEVPLEETMFRSGETVWRFGKDNFALCHFLEEFSKDQQ